MNKSGRRLVIIVGLVVLFIVVGVINLFVYPFQSAKPNFADVERVFNKIEIPADWVEIDSSENRGIAGRACPIEPGTTCFHKSKTFTVPAGVNVEMVETVLLSSGCPSVGVVDNSYIDAPDTKYRFECSIEALDIGGDLNMNDGQVYVSARTP